jgi:hypothetical protein
MGPQIPIALKGQDGLSEVIPYIEKISQPRTFILEAVGETAEL